MNVDILKLGHHGSRTSTADAMVHMSSPEYAIVSAGCGNSYGHPHKEVIEMLTSFEVKVLSTCEEGTILFRSDGAKFKKVDPADL